MKILVEDRSDSNMIRHHNISGTWFIFYFKSKEALDKFKRYSQGIIDECVSKGLIKMMKPILKQVFINCGKIDILYPESHLKNKDKKFHLFKEDRRI